MLAKGAQDKEPQVVTIFIVIAVLGYNATLRGISMFINYDMAKR